MTRRLAALLLLALAAPAAAHAGSASLVTREVPLDGARTLAAAAPARFDLVGLHWRGSGSVSFRTHAVDGGWSPWREAAPEAHDLPDHRSPEARAGAGWRIGSPWWAGPADGIEYRVRGRVQRLRAHFVRSPELLVPVRAPAAAGAPAIVPRSLWGADETIRQGAPSYAPQLRFAVVHHTAGTNTYTRAQAAAIVRGIQVYHVQGNGWNDIGYNLLVDRYGTVYEGRYGGVDRNVVGAHALGFNTGSVGVALLGSYDEASPTAAAETALEQVLAWRLDLAHVDPLSTLNVVSGGSDRFPSGIPVFLRAVSGHRDTGSTACPGDILYARLAAIAGETAAIGLPKLYEPRVNGALGGPVRFRARVSDATPWRVVVTDAAGLEVAVGAGAGPTVDWTWDATLALPGSYRWRMEAGAATPVTGAVGGSAQVALAVTGATLDPETITPDEDGQTDTSTLTFSLTAPATVSVTAYDTIGAPVAELSPPVLRAAGEHAITIGGDELPDGAYTVQVLAQGTNGGTATATASIAVTRTLGGITVSPPAFSPNGDRRADTLTVRFRLTGPAEVRVRVLRDGIWVATPFTGTMRAGARLVRWDGHRRAGRLRDGSYTAVVEATDAVATARLETPFVSDTRPPLVRLLPTGSKRLWVSEPAVVTLRIDGRPLRVEVKQAGARWVAGLARAERVRAVAWDAAGNVGALSAPP